MYSAFSEKTNYDLWLLPVAGHGVEVVRLNGTPLPRRDTLTLESAEQAGWSMQADHTLVALLVTNPPA